MYDPSTGRFLSQDPIGFSAGGFNFYDYVMNDPISSDDPSGLCPINGSRTKQILLCAASLAIRYSLAGVLGINAQSHPGGAFLSNAFLGNTFSSITNAFTGSAGVPLGDVAFGGTSLGLPGATTALGKGIVGTATEEAVNAVSAPGSIVSAVTGTVTDLGEEGLAGPMGLAKAGIDGAVFTAAVAYCTNHQ